MHLLNVHTLALETFSSDIPPYVALSHRWGNREDEVFYQDIMQLSVRRDIVKKPGFAKILGCCNEAAKNRLSYVWVDTCCINQMNSVEVQEAINSMWQWYLECNRCFVYLSDVRSDQVLDANDSDFARSQWFKRGWTLQELLAPAKVIFFAADWKKIGRKGHPRVTNRISLVTGIPEQVLLDGDISSLSVARRLFWASKRETTRREDRAYSLMGLFDITMPIIYGGLDNTFVRFQKEIMKTSVDHSIFAWTVDSASPDITTGLLAPSPAYFMNVDEISYDDFILNFSTRIEAGRALKADYTSTNNGIAISLPMRQVADSVYLAMLRCTLLPESARPLCIYLQKLAGQRNQWVRIRIGELVPLPVDGDLFENKLIFVKEDSSFFHPRKRQRAVSDASIQTAGSVHAQVPRSSSTAPRSFTMRNAIPETAVTLEMERSPTPTSRLPYLSLFRRGDGRSHRPEPPRVLSVLGLDLSGLPPPSPGQHSSPPEGSMTPRASTTMPSALNADKGLMSMIRNRRRHRTKRPQSSDVVQRWPPVRSISPEARANTYEEYRSRSLSPTPTRHLSDALSEIYLLEDFTNRANDFTARTAKQTKSPRSMRLERSTPVGAKFARNEHSKSNSRAAAHVQIDPQLRPTELLGKGPSQTPDSYRGRTLLPKPLGNNNGSSRSPQHTDAPAPDKEYSLQDPPPACAFPATPSPISTYTVSLPSSSAPSTPLPVVFPTLAISESPPGSSILSRDRKHVDTFDSGSNLPLDPLEPFPPRYVRAGLISSDARVPVDTTTGRPRPSTPAQPPPQPKPVNDKGFIYRFLKFFGRTN